MEQSENNTSATSQGTTMWKDLYEKLRKPCLTADLDLQMQVYPDYDTAPAGNAAQGSQKSGSETPICDKNETITIKWRIADMVAVGMIASVAVSLLCCVKHMCCFMKK